MKVKCIDNNKDAMWLTIGKEYEVSNADAYNYRVKCDAGQTCWYGKEYFEIVNDNMLKCISNNEIDDFGSTEVVKRKPLNVNLRTSEIQSLISELNTLHKELEVCVIIHDWGYFIHSWFGEFKVDTEQEVLEALNGMLKLVKKYKGENDDNG